MMVRSSFPSKSVSSSRVSTAPLFGSIVILISGLPSRSASSVFTVRSCLFSLTVFVSKIWSGMSRWQGFFGAWVGSAGESAFAQSVASCCERLVGLFLLVDRGEQLFLVLQLGLDLGLEVLLLLELVVDLVLHLLVGAARGAAAAAAAAAGRRRVAPAALEGNVAGDHAPEHERARADGGADRAELGADHGADDHALERSLGAPRDLILAAPLGDGLRLLLLGLRRPASPRRDRPGRRRVRGRRHAVVGGVGLSAGRQGRVGRGRLDRGRIRGIGIARGRGRARGRAGQARAEESDEDELHGFAAQASVHRCLFPHSSWIGRILPRLWDRRPERLA